MEPVGSLRSWEDKQALQEAPGLNPAEGRDT